jgi:putative ABC transport system permease protein
MIFTTFILALREIRRHLLRSFLTTLGIVIGVASVITIVTLGNGATASISDQIGALGSNLIQVQPGQGGRPGGGGGGPSPRFKVADVEAIREQIAGVTAVAGQAQSAGTAIRNAQNWTTTINGTTNDYFVAQKWSVSAGRLFSSTEEASGKSVCVIGTTIVKNLFQNVDPIGQRFRIKGVSCEVIGVLVSRGQGGFGNDQDDVVVMPIKMVQRRFAGNQDIRAIMISVDPAYDNTGVQKSLSALLRERRNLGPSDEDNFSVLDTKQIADTVSGTTKILTALLGAVAAVSLVVGGIGIMNIMLVSVTERTREIGIRLAIGALGTEVLLQFLVEAVVLSCLGGVIGMVLALVISVAIAAATKIPFSFDIQINLLSFMFSALIGVVFGYFPARRAAALNPIEAGRRIALFRAVNVGGRKIIMTELKAMFEAMGLGPAQTLQAAGSVVFHGAGDDAELEAQLETETLARFGMVSEVFVRGPEEWGQIIAHNPFADAARDFPSRLAVIPLKTLPTPGGAEALTAGARDGELVGTYNRCAYAYYPIGMGLTKLTPRMIERALGSPGTARNWNTAVKLAEMVGAS